MTAIVIAMLVIVALAAAVVVYVAFPHRGEDLPAAPWLSDAMTRAVDALPTVAPQDAGHRPGRGGVGPDAAGAGPRSARQPSLIVRDPRVPWPARRRTCRRPL